MPLQIRPFLNGFAAEVISLNVSDDFDEAVRKLVLDALYDHLVLIFRNQNLTVEQQIRFTEGLGILETAWDSSNTHPSDKRMQVVSNAGRGNISYRTSSQYWHTDRSFVEQPTMATLLHIVQLPPYGGNTLFADMRRAYESLPESTKKLIENLSAYHSFGYRFVELRSRRISQKEAQTEANRYPDVIHPLVRTHPVTKRKALYLSELCLSGIVGVEKEQSDSLLQELYAHALQPEFIYEHRWQPGDLLVWDNPSLMHRASDIPHEHPRTLHRTTTAGPAPV